ncbi:MAG: hypothetical protein EBU26_12100 [Verrucomicrobia bacterium]|nr:hypothetical protein [Verrucomicrobiota bacterium]
MNSQVIGLILLVVGALQMLGGLTDSKFFFFRLIRSRVRLLWGQYTNPFLVLTGILIMIMGSLSLFGFWKD